MSQVKTRFKKQKIDRLEPEILEKKEWLEDPRYLADIENRKTALKYVFRIFTLAVVATLTIFICQGFSFLGFHLPEVTLNWLGATMLSEISVMAGIAVNFVFK